MMICGLDIRFELLYDRMSMSPGSLRPSLDSADLANSVDGTVPVTFAGPIASQRGEACPPFCRQLVDDELHQLDGKAKDRWFRVLM